MLQGQTLKYLIVIIIIVKYVDSLEIFLSKTNDDIEVEHLASFRNKSYEIPLFQTRYLTIRTHPNDIHPVQLGEKNMIGLKYQIKSTLPKVVNIRKEVASSEKNPESNGIVVEDLFICEY
jgi:hypothetical protein